MNSELRKCSPFETGNYCNVLSIDPGTVKMGVAIGAIDISTGGESLLWADTITDKEVLPGKRHLIDIYGERFAKLQGFKESIIELLVEWDIHAIVCESNYMKLYPASYACLTECIYMIRDAALAYSHSIPVITVEPSKVRVAIGVKGNSKGKDSIMPSVARLPIDFVQPQTLDTLAPDAIDAIAILYWFFRNVNL